MKSWDLLKFPQECSLQALTAPSLFEVKRILHAAEKAST